MREITPLDREILRKAVLSYLCMYHPSAFDAETVRRGVRARRYVDWDPSDQEVESALMVLADLGLAERLDGPGDGRVALGATVYWRATAKGVIERERDAEP